MEQEVPKGVADASPNSSNKLEAFPVTSPFPFLLFLCAFSKSTVCLLIKFCRIWSFPVKPCAVFLFFLFWFGKKQRNPYHWCFYLWSKLEDQKDSVWRVQRKFLLKKLPYYEGKKILQSPYLVNTFPQVTTTKEDSKTLVRSGSHPRFIYFYTVFLLYQMTKAWVEGSVLSGLLSSLWPASFGLFETLDFGPCPLFLFLSLSWVLSFIKVWQGFISDMCMEY